MPQPIDMQTELGRATMADRIQAATDRAALVAAARAQTDLDEERSVGETQVAETAETEAENVDPETRRRNPFARRRGAGATGNSDESNPRRNDTDSHRFDVSV